MKIRQLLIATSLFATLSMGGNAMAQDAGNRDNDEVSSLFASMETEASPTSASDVRASQMTASEIRQARALYRSRQRVARLESNLWMGYEPLRPSWNAIPMTSSRYAPRRTYYVPVYYYNR